MCAAFNDLSAIHDQSKDLTCLIETHVNHDDCVDVGSD